MYNLSALDFDNIIQNLLMSDDLLYETERKREYNELIGDYYFNLFQYYGIRRAEKMSYNVRNCNRFWFFDTYNKLRCMDFTHTFLCKNRFCPNCQKLKAVSLVMKFRPHLEKAEQDGFLYHLTLSVPNVPGELLKDERDIIFEAFAKLIDYFNGRIKIKRYNFIQFGYRAAIRSFECTYKGKSFHPHIHSIIYFAKDLHLEKKYINDYSFDYGTLGNKFSDIEILIQKIWRLLVENIRERNRQQRLYNDKVKRFSSLTPLSSVDAYKADLITLQDAIKGDKPLKIKAKRIVKSEIGALKIGYSCKMDKIDDGNCNEVFKYACKVIDNETHEFMTFEQFRFLDRALADAKLFQCYGEWRNIKVDEDIDDSVDKLYYTVKKYFKAYEPEEETLTIPETIERKKSGYRVISKRKIYKSPELLEDLISDEDFKAFYKKAITERENLEKAKQEHYRKNIRNQAVMKQRLLERYRNDKSYENSSEYERSLKETRAQRSHKELLTEDTSVQLDIFDNLPVGEHNKNRTKTHSQLFAKDSFCVKIVSFCAQADANRICFNF